MELTVCWAPEEAEAQRLAHARWPIAGMQGALLSDLRLPSHFAQAASALTEEESAQAVICGPDPTRHIKAITQAALAARACTTSPRLPAVSEDCGKLFLDRFALPGPLYLLQGERG
jgi:hypothetical protein